MIALEFMLVLPVLFIGTLAIFEFGIVMLLEQAIITSATEGAREAAKGADPDEVALAVEQSLRLHNIRILPHSGACVKIDVGCSSETVGDESVACGSEECVQPDEVRVTVYVTRHFGMRSA